MSRHAIDVPNEALADPDSHFITINGIKVHFKEKGSGKPFLMLLHGFGASLFSWQVVLEPLANWGRTVAYDRPAFGLTERPLVKSWHGENPYGTAGQVEMLKGLLEKLEMTEVVLIGHSAGATVALATALQYPTLVKALILVAPAIYLYSPVPSWAGRFLTKRVFRLFGQALVHPTRRFTRRLLSNTWHAPVNITEAMVNGYEKPFHAVNWEAGLWQFSMAPHARDLWKRTDELKMPVLVIAGDDDHVIPTRHSRRLAEITPGAEFVLIPDCGHEPQEEKPELFLSAVNQFLNRIQICK
jgi:pimeloyl-ACP methyl ester carboxylesterase